MEGLEKLGASPQPPEAAACCRRRTEATSPAVNVDFMVVVYGMTISLAVYVNETEW